MHKEEIIKKLISSGPNTMDVSELESLIEKYPYFTTTRLLLLLALTREKNKLPIEKIKDCSSFIHDPKHLYTLLNTSLPEEIFGKYNLITDSPENHEEIKLAKNSGENTLNHADKVADKDEELFDFTDQETEEVIQHDQDFEEQMPNRESDEQDGFELESNPVNKIPELTRVNRFTGWLEELDEENQLDSKPLNPSDDLIEQFISNGQGVIRADKETSLKGDVSGNSIKEDEDFITDTLAQIYVKQGLYAKAIFAYEKLSLKYPEKSIYFATQIEDIKKIINK